jgi:hypothetical protein
VTRADCCSPLPEIQCIGGYCATTHVLR